MDACRGAEPFAIIVPLFCQEIAAAEQQACQQLYSQKAGFPCLPIGKKQGGDENHQQDKEDVFELPQLPVPGEGTVLFWKGDFENQVLQNSQGTDSAAGPAAANG